MLPNALRREPHTRLLSLDVLRGLTIMAMVLVTDPGTYNAVYSQLLHAEWNGPTATDLIFPCFLVMVGVSLVLSFRARLAGGATRTHLAAHALRRCLWLVLLGLLVNGFPTYDLAHLRLPGILQRIGVCYGCASLLYLAFSGQRTLSRTRQVAVVTVLCACLAAYWALLVLYPTPGFGAGRLDSLGSLPAVLDRAVFGVQHMWAYGTTPGHGVTYDPEGLLSTVTAFATVLAGVLAGEQLQGSGTRQRQCGAIATLGTVFFTLGLGLSPWMPLNKKILTPTFALWSAGLSLLLFAALLYVVHVRGHRRGWTLPLVFGTNAIFAFVLSTVITSLLQLLRVRTAAGSEPLHHWLHEHLFATWLPPRPSSLAYAVAVVLLNAALVYPLYRKRVFLRL